MGALWAVLGGLVAIFLGIIGLIYWWAYFLKALAAILPALLIFAGCIAAFIGFTEIRDSLKSKDEDNLSNYKPETKMEEEPEEEKCSTDIDIKGKDNTKKS